LEWLPDWKNHRGFAGVGHTLDAKDHDGSMSQLGQKRRF
jgi:hypothetical protein